MNLSIIIPVRSLEAGKTRLAPHLGAQDRAKVVERMFRHALGVATQSVPPAMVYVVSRSAALLDLATEKGAQPVIEAGSEHNMALAQASQVVDQNLPVLVLSADLPLVTPADINAMALLQQDADVVAATDRAGSGTNALLLRRPGLISYAFSAGSLSRHRQATEAQGMRFAVLRRDGLMADVDEPADLALLDRLV